MARIEPNFRLTGRTSGQTVEASGQDFSLEIELLDAERHSRKVVFTGRELPDGTLSLVIDADDVWDTWEETVEHPPSHSATISVRTHKSHAVRSGTKAAKIPTQV